MSVWRKFLHHFGVHTPDERNFCVYCGKPVWKKWKKQQKKYKKAGLKGGRYKY